MYVIGLTGGVGSGKTEAAKILQKLTSAKLLLADEIGHLAMERESVCYPKIISAFGEEILQADGTIDRKKLAEIVFSQDKKRQILNEIIHPVVIKHMKRYIESHQEQNGLLVIESAILFESGCAQLCNETWYVFVPKEIRIKRLAESRGYSEEKSLAIIDRQLSDKMFQEKCQKVIVNDGDINQLKQRLEDALKTLS